MFRSSECVTFCKKTTVRSESQKFKAKGSTAFGPTTCLFVLSVSRSFGSRSFRAVIGVVLVIVFKVGSANMVLAEIPLVEEIMVKRVVVLPVWERGRWSEHDVFNNLTARPADIFFWPSEVSESEVDALGLSIPGMSSLDLAAIWRCTARTIGNFTGRAARWIGADVGVVTAAPFLATTVREGHASLLACILGYEEDG